MNEQEIEAELRFVKLKMQLDALKLKRKSRVLKDRYLYLSLLLAEQMLHQSKIEAAQNIIIELMDSIPKKSKMQNEKTIVFELTDDMLDKSNSKSSQDQPSYLVDNDGLGKLLPRVE
jgi:hypothetical protein